MSKTKEGLAINVRQAVAILEALREELSKFSKEQLLQQNVDAVAALVVVRKVLRTLIEFRPSIEQLPFFDIDNVDRLELFAMAFVGAQAQYKAIKERNKEPAALAAEGIALRSRLLSDTKALAHRGLVASEPLAKLNGGRGYKQIAADLLLLAALLEGRSELVAGKCATTAQELLRAETLADQLTFAVTQRREPRKAETDALDARKRAFTKFISAYNQVRRAVQFLRYDKGDSDQIAPPLTGTPKTAKARRKSKATATAEPSVSTKGEQRSSIEKPAVSPASETGPKVTDEEATNSSAGHIGDGLPGSEPLPASVGRVGVGLPGSDPFLN